MLQVQSVGIAVAITIATGIGATLVATVVVAVYGSRNVTDIGIIVKKREREGERDAYFCKLIKYHVSFLYILI